VTFKKVREQLGVESQNRIVNNIVLYLNKEYDMIVKHVPNKPPTEYTSPDQKIKMATLNRIKRQISKFDISFNDLGFTGNSISTS